MCPGAREQIFLHGWITCHANNQGRKELSNALPFATIGVLEPRTPTTQKLKLKTCKMKNCSLPWTTGSWKKNNCFHFSHPGSSRRTLLYRTNLSTTTDCHHSDGTSKHRDTSMTFAERSTSNCHEFSRRKVKTNNNIIP